MIFFFLIGGFPQKLVRLRCAQKRELCRRGGHGEFRAARGFTVSTGAAKLWATSDVSSQKCGALGGGQMFFLAFVSIFTIMTQCLYLYWCRGSEFRTEMFALLGIKVLKYSCVVTHLYCSKLIRLFITLYCLCIINYRAYMPLFSWNGHLFLEES